MANVTVGTLIGLFVKSLSLLTMVSQFIFLPSIMLSGIMFPSEMLPKFLQYIGYIFPASWGYKLMCSNSISLVNSLPLIFIICVGMIISVIKLNKLKCE